MAPNYWENSQRFVDQFGDSDWYGKRPFSYVESVKELDKQLARVRTSPSKVYARSSWYISREIFFFDDTISNMSAFTLLKMTTETYIAIAFIVVKMFENW